MSNEHLDEKPRETKTSNVILKVAGVVAALAVLAGTATTFVESLAPLQEAVVSLFHQDKQQIETKEDSNKSTDSEIPSVVVVDTATHTLNIGDSVTVFDVYTFKFTEVVKGSSGPVAVLEATQTLESFYNSNEGAYPESDNELKKTIKVRASTFLLDQSLEEAVPFGSEWHYVTVIGKSFIGYETVELEFYWVERFGG